MTRHSSLDHQRMRTPCVTVFAFSAVIATGAVRCIDVLAQVIHGLGHTLMLVLVTGELRVLTLRNILENRSARDLTASLFASRNDYLRLTRSAWLFHDLRWSWQRRTVAAGGSLANASSMVLMWLWYQSMVTAGTWVDSVSCYLATAFLARFCISSCAAMVSVPDIVALLHGRHCLWACGPAFAIRYRDPNDMDRSSVATPRLQSLVEILAREASTRGGQSAGIALLAHRDGQPAITFDKVVKGKRNDIVSVLCTTMHTLIARAEAEGYGPAPTAEAALLHLRYATGGATHWHNAQPHWYEHYPAMMHHRIEDGRLLSAPHEVFNLIAHNGDMDAVYLSVRQGADSARQLFAQSDARQFFSRAMPVSTSQGDSDSRSIAEWVDFVHTQGLSYKSLRFACFTAGIDISDPVAMGDVDLDQIAECAAQLDAALAQKISTLTTCPPRFSDLRPMLAADIRDILWHRLHRIVEPGYADVTLTAFENAFFHHDLQWVLRQASRDLVGAYALMISTTMEPRIGAFALTQAFSIGVNRTRGEVFGSAEPMGVTTALFDSLPSDDALQYFLEDGMYALIELSRPASGDPVRIFNRSTASDTDDCASTVAPARVNWFPVNNNPKITRINRPYVPGAEIERDLRDIPYVLKQINRSFEPNGENYKTMSSFSDLLIANMGARGREPKTFDLVLYGVDFNEDLIREFAAEITSILPDLRVQADNSGYILSELKRVKREGDGGYGKRTIFLGVSNSAQTQSTLAVARLATELVGVNRSFVLTQSFFNSMSQAIGQGYLPIDPIIPNTFVNLTHYGADGRCGRRRAEAATIVPVATHAVLTEILLAVCRKAIAARGADGDRPGAFEVRHDLQLADLAAFRDFQATVYDVEIPNRLGFNAAGTVFDSPDHAAIEAEARGRAENIIEFVRAYALFAGYIIVATLFGVPLISTLTAPLGEIAGLHTVALILDALLFLSAFWLIHLLLRYMRGRPLFERIGARAEVYIDRRAIARMIERYNATLFANTPAFLTPFFYSADTVQDALHRFGMRAHRGVITIHRILDERMGLDEANGAAEANMVLAQLGGIRFNAGQPQSRDKVRSGSQYVATTTSARKSRPYQTILSDQLGSLRARYSGKLSPALLRLINRRLLDLSDGLIVEYLIGYRRKCLVDRAVWDVLAWVPGMDWLYKVLMARGIDLMKISGAADTANQAQIQSTKHPVSPLDIDAQTMQSRLSFSVLDHEVAEAESFAIVNFIEDGLIVKLNGHALRQLRNPMYGEILLAAANTKQPGQLVGVALDADGGDVTARVSCSEGQEYIEITPLDGHFQITIPIAQLDEEQQAFLRTGLRVATEQSLMAVA